MNRTFIIFAMLNCTLAACATPDGVEKYTQLRTVFERYKLALNSPESEQMSYFTEPMWKALQGSRKFSSPDTNGDVQLFNHFPEGIVVKKSVETINQDKGCLVLLGTGTGGAPADYIISFVRQKNRWVFADIFTEVYQTEEDRWMSVPVCEHDQRYHLRRDVK